MHIRTFRAANLQDALDQIRQSMGREASVLHTRQVRDGWRGWLGRSYVEVTAGLRDRREEEPPASMRRFEEPRIASESSSADVGAGQGGGLGQGGAGTNHPPVLLAHRDALIAEGVAAEIADRWLSSAAGFATATGVDVHDHFAATHAPWDDHLRAAVGREIRIASPIRTQPGDRRVVALVGPTGVGKTTTVAKLAAGFRLEARRRVGLLTIDTFRIAAVQQLQAYAEIMDLPMEVVENTDGMTAALDRLSDVDLVLIDTAGRSPRSDARIDQLVDMLGRARPDETHLVVSATAGPHAIAGVLRGFAPVSPTATILTKIDETPWTAPALSALVGSPGGESGRDAVPLSYVTHGQQVPDDISVADPAALTRRLMSDASAGNTADVFRDADAYAARAA